MPLTPTIWTIRSGAAFLLVCTTVLGGCRADARPDTIELSGPTMGTTWRVKAVVEPGRRGADVRVEIDGAIRDLLARVTALVSTWDPESELSRFNRSSSVEPFAVAPETYELFRQAVSLSVETGGAFDVTVAPLVEAWGFGAAGATPTPPDAQTLAALREHTGVRHLELDPQGRWVRTRVAGLQCDFSAFAPGWAADRIAELLEQHGVRRALVDVGGELVARGTNESGVPWQVAVERPQEREHAIARLVPLRDAAIATSGDYRNYREVDGDRVTHIIDPATGRPIGHRLASATVIDSRAVRADALATAVMVLGPEAGMALAERLDLAVMLIVRLPDGRFEQRLSPRFAALTGSTR